MLGFIKSISRIVVCVSMLMAASMSHALNVEYYTTGAFSVGTNVNSPTIANGLTSPAILSNSYYFDTSKVTISASTLTYEYSGDSEVGLPGNAILGDFYVTSSNLMPQSFNGIGFVLDIYQVSPGGGPGILDAIVNGTLAVSTGVGPTSSTSTLNVSYNPASVVVSSVPPILYSISGTNGLGNPGESINGGISQGQPQRTSINAAATLGLGSSSSVGLPNTSSTSLLMLGCVAGFGLIRRRLVMA